MLGQQELLETAAKHLLKKKRKKHSPPPACGRGTSNRIALSPLHFLQCQWPHQLLCYRPHSTLLTRWAYRHPLHRCALGLSRVSQGDFSSLSSLPSVPTNKAFHYGTPTAVARVAILSHLRACTSKSIYSFLHHLLVTACCPCND